ncbi:MAG: ABC transporter ATP-binding protein [Lachnospiraceae bacterium]|nr:ABC transporter ATP-binding protein [Lachnospiraceae bacterium]
MIDVRNVSKQYRKTLANDNVTIGVKSGELAMLVGPNGAGKSTLIKSICGLLRFTGYIAIDGHPNKTKEAKQALGYIPEMPALYPMLTVWEHLEFIAKAYRLPDTWKSLADDLVDKFELTDKKNKLGKELSKGMQQKVSICCGLLTSPKAIIFDEPLIGLDPHAIRELKNIIIKLKELGCAVLISTHMIESMEENWDVTYIMNKGKVQAVVRPSDLESGDSLEDMFFKITEPDKKDIEV